MIRRTIQTITKLVLAICIVLGTFGKADCDEPWQRHTIDNTLKGADGVRLGDFNGDSLLDIVTGWEESGVVRLYLNPGHTKAKQPWPQVTVGKAKSPEDAVPFDIDGDGQLEIVSCHEGKLRQVIVHHFRGDKLRGQAKHEALLNPERWTSNALTQLDGQQWMFAAPIKLNNGSHALVIGSKGNHATLTLLYPPNENAPIEEWVPHKLRDAGWIMSIQIMDMDADGDFDIGFSDRKGAHRGIGWLEQPGNPSDSSKLSDTLKAKSVQANSSKWAEHKIGANDLEPMFVDMTPSRVISATRNSKWLAFKKIENGWKKSVHENPPNISLGKAIKPLKKTASGEAIVMTANTHAAKELSDNPGIWVKNPNKNWLPIDNLTKTKFDRIELIDLDGDGDLDVLTCEERQQLGIVWYENPEK